MSANPVLSFIRKWPKLVIFILLVVLFVCFKGSIYRACVSYKLIRARNSESIFIRKSPPYLRETPDEIIQQSLDSTADALSFTTSHCATGAAELYRGGKTNCIGYANVCSFFCNRGLVSSHILSHADSYVAELYIFGFNVHRLFSSPFWKDHDVVVITDGKTQERTIVDPTLYDYTGIGMVTERK